MRRWFLLAGALCVAPVHSANLCVNADGTEKAWAGAGYNASECDAWFSSINAAASATAASGDTLILSMLEDTVHMLSADTPAGRSFSVRNAENSSDYSRCVVSAAGGNMLQDLSAGGTVMLRGVTVRDGVSTAAVQVSGTATSDAAFVVDSVHFDANVSLAPGRALPPALALATEPETHTVSYTVTRSRFTNNTHIGAGAGALSFVDGTRLVVHRSLFEGNVAEADTGGAIWINPARRTDGCHATVLSSEFYGNAAATGGAMLASRDCNVTVHDTVTGAVNRGNVTTSADEFGRGVMFVLTDDTRVSLRVSDSEFAYNYVNPQSQSADGAAVRVANGAVGKGFVTALFEDSVFHHNEGWSGPAIHAGGETVSTVRRCRFFNNVARGFAGAYFASGTRDSPPFGSHTITHSLFANNHTDNRGGAIRVAEYSSVDVSNSTFFNNTALDNGNHIDARTALGGALSTVTNSVFWSDEDNGLADIASEANGSFGMIQYSALRPDAVADSGATLSDIVELERSPVMGDGALRASSPLIDAGLNLDGQVPALDIAGQPVPAGPGWDIGAFEFWRTPVTDKRQWERP
ncbi:MAG: right-handed parallel beta-helix repeat-containing protein [Pseudomonadota bacterium]